MRVSLGVKRRKRDESLLEEWKPKLIRMFESLGNQDRGACFKP